MGYYDSLITSQGETVVYYAYSFEDSRNSTTNLKVGKYATGTNITAVVRSQPSVINYGEAGIYKTEVILVLTKTAVTKMGVIKWNNKYYEVDNVDEVYWSKRGTSTFQYYRCKCIELIEFLGA